MKQNLNIRMKVFIILVHQIEFFSIQIFLFKVLILHFVILKGNFFFLRTIMEFFQKIQQWLQLLTRIIPNFIFIWKICKAALMKPEQGHINNCHTFHFMNT